MTFDTDDDERLAQAMAEELATREAPITVVLRPTTALQLVGLLQLALRHPGPSEAHRYVAQTFIAHVSAALADAPAVLEVIRRGGDPAEDR